MTVRYPLSVENRGKAEIKDADGGLVGVIEDIALAEQMVALMNQRNVSQQTGPNLMAMLVKETA